MRVTRNAYKIFAGKRVKQAMHLKIMVEAYNLDFVRKLFSRETCGLAFVIIATSIPPSQSDNVSLKSTLILSFHLPLFSPVFSNPSGFQNKVLIKLLILLHVQPVSSPIIWNHLFAVYFTMLSVSKRLFSEWQVEKQLEGSGRDVHEQLSLNFSVGELRKTKKTLYQDCRFSQPGLEPDTSRVTIHLQDSHTPP